MPYFVERDTVNFLSNYYNFGNVRFNREARMRFGGTAKTSRRLEAMPSLYGTKKTLLQTVAERRKDVLRQPSAPRKGRVGRKQDLGSEEDSVSNRPISVCAFCCELFLQIEFDFTDLCQISSLFPLPHLCEA